MVENPQQFHKEGTVIREASPEAALSFDAVIVHGKNWRRYRLKLKLKHKYDEIFKGKEPLPLKLNIDSRIAALGMGELRKAFKESGKWKNQVRGETLLIAETFVDPGQKKLRNTLAKLIKHQQIKHLIEAFFHHQFHLSFLILISNQP